MKNVHKKKLTINPEFETKICRNYINQYKTAMLEGLVKYILVKIRNYKQSVHT